MNVFFWRKNSIIDKFSVKLADEIFSHIQPEIAAQYFNAGDEAKNIKGKEKRKQSRDLLNVDKILNEAISEVMRFRDQNKLGVYGTARLHMKLMARLQELGYDERTTKQFNNAIMLRMQ